MSKQCWLFKDNFLLWFVFTIRFFDYGQLLVLAAHFLPFTLFRSYTIVFLSRDIQVALHSARRTQPYVVTNSVVYFSNSVPEERGGSPAPLRLRKLIDLVSLLFFGVGPKI